MKLSDNSHQLDLELAIAASSGDEQAWRQIYDLTCQPLFNFLCYQTGDREAAMDLTQDTYVTALKRLDSYHGQGSLLSWLRSVALRKCMDWRRRLASNLRKIAAFTQEFSSPVDSSTGDNFCDLGAPFQANLDRLTPRQRAALLLRELDDLPFAEIAESLGCSEATARVHYHRACANMKKWLENGDDLIFSARTGGFLS